ncbi:MAG: iron-molybdenum cofactor biosynthesis protein [Bacteroidales bacterium]|nr:iron-molybdenum cofactor biosynthesis protein [Bacteroidales bacterium]
MKIAVPSNDRVTLCPHFGRTEGFLIFQTSNQQVLTTEYRPNTFTHHVMGQEHHHGHEEHSHEHHGNHSHNRILNALEDCEVVIAGGMGYRLQEDLIQAGKEIYITSQTEALKAVTLFLENKLVSDKDSCCH